MLLRRATASVKSYFLKYALQTEIAKIH